jgi:ribosomal protein S18 acetylase RimI-like enzyme
LHLEPLISESESRLWYVVKEDICVYYFFIYDWLLQKERTQIFLALDSDVVVGLMVIYDCSIAQLRGERVAVEFMLANLNCQVCDVQVPANCESLLLEKYPKHSLQAHVTLMKIEKSQEHLSIKVKPEPLSIQDAEAVAQIMHESYPKMWSNIQADGIRMLMSAREARWLGIKVGSELAAFGYAMLTPKVSHITWIATNPGYEKKGYATSIVSCLVKECLAKSDGVIIYVMDENTVAKKVYLKVGFKPYKSYFFVKA